MNLKKWFLDKFTGFGKDDLTPSSYINNFRSLLEHRLRTGAKVENLTPIPIILTIDAFVKLNKDYSEMDRLYLDAIRQGRKEFNFDDYEILRKPSDNVVEVETVKELDEMHFEPGHVIEVPESVMERPSTRDLILKKYPCIKEEELEFVYRCGDRYNLYLKIDELIGGEDEE